MMNKTELDYAAILWEFFKEILDLGVYKYADKSYLFWKTRF